MANKQEKTSRSVQTFEIFIPMRNFTVLINATYDPWRTIFFSQFPNYFFHIFVNHHKCYGWRQYAAER